MARRDEQRSAVLDPGDWFSGAWPGSRSGRSRSRTKASRSERPARTRAGLKGLWAGIPVIRLVRRRHRPLSRGRRRSNRARHVRTRRLMSVQRRRIRVRADRAGNDNSKFLDPTRVQPCADAPRRRAEVGELPAHRAKRSSVPSPQQAIRPARPKACTARRRCRRSKTSRDRNRS
jgi:hypothetical protein